MKRLLVPAVLLLSLAGALGFHWVTYPNAHGRTFCMIAKDNLSFADTFLSADSQLAFAFKHPMLAGQIVVGQGYCVAR